MTKEQKSGARILVIDDDQDILMLVRRTLERQGLTNVTPCDSVPRAQELFVTLQPDLVLMDLTMPGAAGLELLDYFRATDPTVPILVLTGWTDPETRRKCLAAGARGVLAKPLLPDAMTLVLEQLAARLC